MRAAALFIALIGAILSLPLLPFLLPIGLACLARWCWRHWRRR
ncbi:hypothetical protein [Silvimonas iriomotensis]|nr:hypothetical protein [Silvimonas iriomotensis]